MASIDCPLYAIHTLSDTSRFDLNLLELKKHGAKFSSPIKFR